MSGLKNIKTLIKKIPMQIIGIVFLAVLAAQLLYVSDLYSSESKPPVFPQVRFKGEYRIGDSDWCTYTPGRHIPATKGDVTLKGNFHMFMPSGEYLGLADGSTQIAFFLDHINLTVLQNDIAVYSSDNENNTFPVSLCGQSWVCHSFENNTTEEVVLLLNNPHCFGNASAVDSMLSNLYLSVDMYLEKQVTENDKLQRNIGLMFIIVSVALLGTAVLSTLINVRNNRLIWMLGLSVLSAGVYILYSTPGIYFLTDSITFNTTILGISMMFYMLLIFCIITFMLEKHKKSATAITVALGFSIAVFLILPVVLPVSFYDTWTFWAAVQNTANMAMIICMIMEIRTADRKSRIPFAGMIPMLISFGIDSVATGLGWWSGGKISKYVFIILFIATLVMVLKIIPNSINAMAKAKELEVQKSVLKAEKKAIEAELKDSRISLMLSQIQPHFIYNTLGTIERLCLKDPEKAFELVRNFTLYLRGNFSELDSTVPIPFMEEIKHIQYYTNIEKVRFPDMETEYILNATDFVLPALSVQPLVENSIKHGLMRLEEGGKVTIRSYETDRHFCVEVSDNGGGFDVNRPVDSKKHVGIRNIRGRLAAMVNGQLIIESEKGVGTKATILIPKEEIV